MSTKDWQDLVKHYADILACYNGCDANQSSVKDEIAKRMLDIQCGE